MYITRNTISNTTGLAANTTVAASSPLSLRYLHSHTTLLHTRHHRPSCTDQPLATCHPTDSDAELCRWCHVYGGTPAAPAFTAEAGETDAASATHDWIAAPTNTKKWTTVISAKMKCKQDEPPRRLRTSKIAEDGAQLVRWSDVILLADERASDVE